MYILINIFVVEIVDIYELKLWFSIYFLRPQKSDLFLLRLKMHHLWNHVPRELIDGSSQIVADILFMVLLELLWNRSLVGLPVPEIYGFKLGPFLAPEETGHLFWDWGST